MYSKNLQFIGDYSLNTLWNNFGIKSEYDVPDEVFMIKELVPNSLDGLRGIVKYHKEFNKL